MAKCERCGTAGLDMRNMQVDAEKKQFVGPCCVKSNINKAFSNDVEYGIEFSSHMGLRAYGSYGGLSVEFKKTSEELKQWMEPQTNQEQELNPTSPTTTT